MLSHPFRIGLDRRVVAVADGSDQQQAEAVAVLVTTVKGERPLAPAFGVTDPVASLLDAAEVNAALAVFGPAVTVSAVTVTNIGQTSETVNLTLEDDLR